MRNTCLSYFHWAEPSAPSQRGGVGWGSGNGDSGLPAASSPGWLGARGSGLPADGAHLRLPGRRTGRKAGLSTCPESLGCHPGPSDPPSKKESGKMSFQALILSTHGWAPWRAGAPLRAHRPPESHRHSGQDPSPRTCRFAATETSAFLQSFHTDHLRLSARPHH